MNIKTPELFNSVNTQTHIGWSEGEERGMNAEGY
jgi:hypothetical protein